MDKDFLLLYTVRNEGLMVIYKKECKIFCKARVKCDEGKEND